MGFIPSLAQITAQTGAVGFQRRRHLQILPALLDPALMNFAKATAEPGVPQGAIKGNSAIKRLAQTVTHAGMDGPHVFEFDGELALLLEAPQRASFDPDLTRLFLRRYQAGTLRLLPIATPMRDGATYAGECAMYTD